MLMDDFIETAVRKGCQNAKVAVIIPTQTRNSDPNRRHFDG